MTPCDSVGALQVAAHLKACTESREELLAALKDLMACDLAIGGNPNVVGLLMRRVSAVIARAEALHE